MSVIVSPQDFMIQMGDPTGTGKGGESIWGGKFEDEISAELKVTAVSTATSCHCPCVSSVCWTHKPAQRALFPA